MSEGLEEAPRKRRKLKIFTRKRVAIAAAAIVLFSFGALFQHFYVEPVVSENVAGKYALCLTQKQVLDSRFAECAAEVEDLNNLYRACSYDLKQCQQT